MASFLLFKRIARRFRAGDYDPASDNDLSYEDALLDWKIRRFMKTEYGQAEPPRGVFGRVLAAIRAGASAGAGGAWVGARLGRVVAQFYDALSRPTAASRLVPGLVAFGLVLAVLTPDARTVTFQGSPSIEGQALVTSPQAIMENELAAQAKRDEVIRRGNVPEGLGQFYPPANIGFYDPVERQMTVRKQNGSNEKDIESENLLITYSGGF